MLLTRQIAQAWLDRDTSNAAVAPRSAIGGRGRWPWIGKLSRSTPANRRPGVEWRVGEPNREHRGQTSLATPRDRRMTPELAGVERLAVGRASFRGAGAQQAPDLEVPQVVILPEGGRLKRIRPDPPRCRVRRRSLRRTSVSERADRPKAKKRYGPHCLHVDPLWPVKIPIPLNQFVRSTTDPGKIA